MRPELKTFLPSSTRCSVLRKPKDLFPFDHLRRGMDPKTDKLVRRTTMIATVTAAYFLLTEDYGPNPSALDPIKRAIKSAEMSVKKFFFNSGEDTEENTNDVKEKS